MEIKGKSFIVTGGGSGLGAATAVMLVEAGATVIVVDVDLTTGAQLVETLGAAARFVQADVRDATSVQLAVDSAVDAFGGLHGAINCAGVAIGRRTLGKDGPHRLEDFERVIAINLTGTFNVARLAAAAIAKNAPGANGERGVIINTASVAAFEGQIGQAAYAASKGGVAALTLPLARDLARDGIRVAAIAPGIFDTPMLAGLPEAARMSLGKQVPFPPRLGQPREYAALVKHIIENEMLNGEVIRLDGAIRMGPR